ncbi:MAG: hypothetical protein WBZ45_07565 [Acidimicrobiia bacterium]
MDQLQIIRSLFTDLDEAGVAYVHWKSNEHLAAAVLGETDLDLLVDPVDRATFEQSLKDHGFVTMLPPKARTLPDIESHLGFDATTGTLVHLDVHYRLILGEQLIKNHHLPLEKWLLSDHSTMDEVPVPLVEKEFMLLFVRAMLKTTNRQLLRSIVKGGPPMPERIIREITWLGSRIDLSRLTDVIGESGLDLHTSEIVDFLDRTRDNRADWRYVRDKRRSLRARLRAYERLPRYVAVPKRIWLRLRSKPWMRRLGFGIPPRHLATAAPLIAFVGADGSGKTRLSRDIETWLGKKLLVHHVYFGQPKSGLVFRLLNKPGSMARHRDEAHYPPRGLLGLVVRVTDATKWLLVARRRKMLAKKARHDVAVGEVVIAERYPLEDFHSMESPMDGPRLGGSGMLAKAEARSYSSIPLPELLLVLKTDLQTLRDRKIDLTVDEHTAKVQAVATLTAAPGRVIIDVGVPYEEVLLRAKTEIWGALLEAR